MASPSVTYTFANGTTADATQVNQNFSDLIAAMTDGSKSFSIDALTVAGTATLNGAVNLGNATGNDITVTGYIASAIIPKTDATYALGGSSNAWSALYVEGATSLDGAVTINEAGANVDFRVEGDSDTSLLVCDASADKVGIGTATPSYKIDVYTASGAIGQIIRTDTLALDGSQAALYISAKKSGGTARTASLGLSGQGGAVQETAAFLTLDQPDGTVQVYWSGPDDNFRTTTGTFDYVGTNSGTVVGTQTSDERLKKNIKDLNYGLSDVLNLHPIEFEIYGEKDIGFSAQKTKLIIPESVYDSKEEFEVDGEKFSNKLKMYYVKLIPVLVKAIQELKSEIDHLKSK